ncbi:MAG: hypothetical protein AMXMBFR47_13550 [Planctomycetota bacterium]
MEADSWRRFRPHLLAFVLLLGLYGLSRAYVVGVSVAHGPKYVGGRAVLLSNGELSYGGLWQTAAVDWWFVPPARMVEYEPRIRYPIIILAAVVLGHLLIRIRYERRYPEGCCEACGYSLTGNQSGRCPECGTSIAGSHPNRNRWPKRLTTVCAYALILGLIPILENMFVVERTRLTIPSFQKETYVAICFGNTELITFRHTQQPTALGEFMTGYPLLLNGAPETFLSDENDVAVCPYRSRRYRRPTDPRGCRILTIVDDLLPTKGDVEKLHAHVPRLAELIKLHILDQPGPSMFEIAIGAACRTPAEWSYRQLNSFLPD